MPLRIRSEEHTSELQSHSEISYAVFCLKKKKNTTRLVEQHLISRNARTGHRETALDFCPQSPYRFSASLVYNITYFFFFNDTATTEIYTLSYTLSLHDALPI